MTTTTMSYAVFDKQPETLPDFVWTPWVINLGDDLEQTRRLVINKFIRNRGGLDGLQKIFLYEHPEKAIRHRNGKLAQVVCVEYDIKPN